MALDLEDLRKVAAESEGKVYEGRKLDGKAAELWNERKTLNGELTQLKVNSEGRDEVPGTDEFLRVQEIGLSLVELDERLRELGVEI